MFSHADYGEENYAHIIRKNAENPLTEHKSRKDKLSLPPPVPCTTVTGLYAAENTTLRVGEHLNGNFLNRTNKAAAPGHIRF